MEKLTSLATPIPVEKIHLLHDLGLTEAEKQPVNQFRQYLGETCLDEDDWTLFKWLKFYKFNTLSASKAYLTSREEKLNLRVPKMLEEKFQPLEVLRKFYPGGMCGYNKEGLPVMVFMYGSMDMRGLMRSASKQELESLIFLQMEQLNLLCMKQSIKLKKRVDGHIIIGDMHNVGPNNLSLPGLKMFMHLVDIMENYYPYCIKKIILIRTPTLFPLLWKLTWPFLSENLRERINLLTGNYRAALLREIKSDQLPKCYGGTRTDPDGNPNCVTWICQGGDVPKSYYKTDEFKLDHLEAVWIEPSRFLTVKCRVKVSGSLLKWEFCTASFDIGFGIMYQEEEGKEDGTKEVLVPIRRFKSHHCVEDGSYICKRKGTYIVVFDNSYSVSRWKHLYYKVDILAIDLTTEENMHQHEKQCPFGSTDLQTSEHSVRIPFTHSKYQSTHLFSKSDQSVLDNCRFKNSERRKSEESDKV